MTKFISTLLVIAIVTVRSANAELPLTSFSSGGVRVQLSASTTTFLRGGVGIGIQMNRNSYRFSYPLDMPGYKLDTVYEHGYRIEKGASAITVLDDTPGRQVVRIVINECHENSSYTDCAYGERTILYFHQGAKQIERAFAASYTDSLQKYQYGQSGVAARVLRTVKAKYDGTPIYITTYDTSCAPQASYSVVALTPQIDHANNFRVPRAPKAGDLIGLSNDGVPLDTNTVTLATKESTPLNGCANE